MIEANNSSHIMEAATAAAAAAAAATQQQQPLGQQLLSNSITCEPRASEAAAAPAPAAVGGMESEFEQQRRQRIERNRQILQELEVDRVAANLQAQLESNRRNRGGGKRTRATAAGSSTDAACSGNSDQPSRRSGRLAGQAAQIASAQADALIDAAEGGGTDADQHLLTQEEYFQLHDMPLVDWESDGRFKGWVNPVIRERYGMAGSAAEAWEEHGGGKFVRNPDGSAKDAAAKMFLKNPNQYFYRHVAPHETQAQGEWTPEEHELFMQVAQREGVGDKWGLFASYIPQRVGYQCSAHYRDVCVARGLIRDSRFRMTREGKAVFVGEGKAGSKQRERR